MRALLFSLLLLTGPALAQVYTYIDAEGNRVFTDQPLPGDLAARCQAWETAVTLAQ